MRREDRYESVCMSWLTARSEVRERKEYEFPDGTSRKNTFLSSFSFSDGMSGTPVSERYILCQLETKGLILAPDQQFSLWSVLECQATEQIPVESRVFCGLCLSQCVHSTPAQWLDCLLPWLYFLNFSFNQNTQNTCRYNSIDVIDLVLHCGLICLLCKLDLFETTKSLSWYDYDRDLVSWYDYDMELFSWYDYDRDLVSWCDYDSELVSW